MSKTTDLDATVITMSDLWGDALWWVCGCTITALVLTEHFDALPGAAVAFLAALWIVGVGTPRSGHETKGTP
jgi:hypothetical protein